jgi:hypothetical protein
MKIYNIASLIQISISIFSLLTFQISKMSDRIPGCKTVKEALKIRKKLGNLKELKTLIEHYDDKLSKFEQSRSCTRTKSAEAGKKFATIRRPGSTTNASKGKQSRPRVRLPQTTPMSNVSTPQMSTRAIET